MNSLTTGYGSRFSVYIVKLFIEMKKQKTITGRKFRELMSMVAEDATAAIDTINISVHGNTFTFDLQGATINITINEPATPRQKGGQR